MNRVLKQNCRKNKATLILLLIVSLFSCEQKDVCEEARKRFMIRKHDYEFFVQNIYCYNQLSTIAIGGGSKDTLIEILKILVNSDSLKSLWINGINMDTLPEVLYEFDKLDDLSIRHCNLEYIDPRISNLSNLREIDFSFNKLTDIPFINSELRYINVANNQLDHLPVHFSSLANLKYIDIIFNDIQYIPIDSLKWDSLKIISLFGNKIDSLQIMKLEEVFGTDRVSNNHPNSN
jgi:Leucine-rich repeat (LRR) protein